VHPTAEAVYDVARVEMPTLALKTVYQTLNDLAAMGEIQQLDLGTGSTRFDPNVDPHHHLVCTRCGKVRDLHQHFDELKVPARRRQGFLIGSAEVVFRGLCDTCAAATEQADLSSKQSSSNQPVHLYEENLHA
jgi:Fe2+ or Zn2+ uptake regulation protein